MTTRLILFSALALGISHTAQAWLFLGNPKISIAVDRPEVDLVSATVVLDQVRVHKCGGGYTDYAVDETIDAVAGWDITVTGGDLCGVSFDWDSTMAIEGDDWALDYDEVRTSVTLDGSTTVWTGLTPFTVTEGEFSGNPPRLYVTVE